MTFQCRMHFSDYAFCKLSNELLQINLLNLNVMVVFFVSFTVYENNSENHTSKPGFRFQQAVSQQITHFRSSMNSANLRTMAFFLLYLMRSIFIQSYPSQNLLNSISVIYFFTHMAYCCLNGKGFGLLCSKYNIN